MTPTTRDAIAQAIADLAPLEKSIREARAAGCASIRFVGEEYYEVAEKALASLRSLAPAPADQSDSMQVALWMMSNGYATGHGDTIADMLVELEGQAKSVHFEQKDNTMTSIARVVIADLLEKAIEVSDRTAMNAQLVGVIKYHREAIIASLRRAPADQSDAPEHLRVRNSIIITGDTIETSVLIGAAPSELSDNLIMSSGKFRELYGDHQILADHAAIRARKP